jgi:polysaccharide pyruvyl transferase WcaK-like protein
MRSIAKNNHVLQVDHPELCADHERRFGHSPLETVTHAAASLSQTLGVDHVQTRNIAMHNLDASRCRQVLENLYCSARCIVTTRLHGAVIGLSLGIPTIAWSNDRKIEAFYDLAGLRDWVTADSSTISRLAAHIGAQPDCQAGRAVQ